MTRRLIDGAILGYALTGGVLWWTAHLTVSSVLVPLACEQDRGVWPIHVTTAVTAVGAAVAIWTSWLVRATSTEITEANGRNRFLGDVAIVFNVISLALIVVEGIPPLVLGPCAR